MATTPESPALAALASQPAYVPAKSSPAKAPGVAAEGVPSPPVEPDERFRRCEATLEHTFDDQQLLTQSLTHASIARTRLESNERLEFLGDAIMGTVVCEYLFATYPEYAEGELTRIKSSVVSRNTCARLSKELGIGECLLLGKGLAVHERIPDSILAAAFESVVAALYLDGGWDIARKFLLKSLGPEIENIAQSTHGQNFKSQLQQLSQKDFSETPVYRLLDEKGPDHSKCFQVAAAIGEKLYPSAWGPNKKEAEQHAARNALKTLNSPESEIDEPGPVDETLVAAVEESEEQANTSQLNDAS